MSLNNSVFDKFQLALEWVNVTSLMLAFLPVIYQYRHMGKFLGICSSFLYLAAKTLHFYEQGMIHNTDILMFIPIQTWQLKLFLRRRRLYLGLEARVRAYDFCALWQWYQKSSFQRWKTISNTVLDLSTALLRAK